MSQFRDPQVFAVAGYIKSMKRNWITACRELDYLIGQDVHKKAQSYLHAVLVIPGCAAAFRTELFRNVISFDHDTLTEDLDFTYKIHRQNMTIRFDKDAVVYTQDPDTLNDYVNQMRRWIGGGWQNLLKHWDIVLFRPGHTIEISLVYVEGLLFGLLFFILPVKYLLFLLVFAGVYHYRANTRNLWCYTAA